MWGGRPCNRGDPEQNLLWFNSASFHTLEQWLASEMERSILRYYFSPQDRFGRVRDLKKYVMERRAPKSYLQGLELRLQDVNGGELVEEKGKVSEGLRGYEESMRQELQKNIVSLLDDKKKKKKKRPRKQKTQKIQIDTEADPIPVNPQIQVHSASFQLDFQEKPIAQGKTLATEMQCSTDPRLQIQQSSTLSQVLLNIQLNSTQTIQLDFCSCSNLDPQHSKCANSTLSCFMSATSLQTCVGLPSSEQIIIQQCGQTDNSFDSVRLQRNSSHTHIGASLIEELPKEQNNHDSDTHTVINGEFGQAKAKRRRRRRNQNAQSKVSEQFRDRVVSSIINRQLTALIDGLSTESNSYYESKVLAFQRVRYFARSLYPMGQAVLFGSNAVGLSLPSSDIDVMLVQLPCRTKEQVCDCLAQIAIYINAMGWVTSCSTYFNAKVPVVKLEIDPTVGYYTPKRKADYFQMADPYVGYCLDLKEGGKGVSVRVDITVSVEEGVSGSTELMRGWLEERPSLQRVLLALKYSLAVRGFSENFKGGIGSYCLFVMVAAYFVQFVEGREQADCEILLGLLKFYGEDFQNQLKVITLCEQGGCFIENEQARERFQLSDQVLFSNPLKIIDPLNGKLMSSSCFQFNSIKAQWRRIRGEILRIEEMVEGEIEGCFANAAEVAKLAANRKAFERWVGKFQARVQFSVARIISGC